MSDSIQHVRRDVQVMQVKHKGSVPDRKNKKDKKNAFSGFLGEKEEKKRKDERDTKQRTQERTVDNVQDCDIGTEIDKGLSPDGTCGTIIDTEV
ncbi:MAG: hypothetical protein GY941_27740 [Planctomycetes bacterium]|nr:hypothetical protein [Planctomycetota bacterium]